MSGGSGPSNLIFSLLPVVVNIVFQQIVVSALRLRTHALLTAAQVRFEACIQRSATADYREASLYLSTTVVSVATTVIMPFFATFAATSVLDTDIQRYEAVISNITLTALLSGVVFNLLQQFQPVRVCMHCYCT